MALQQPQADRRPRILVLFPPANGCKLLVSCRLADWYEFRFSNIFPVLHSLHLGFFGQYRPDAVHLNINTGVNLIQNLISGVIARFFRIPTLCQFHGENIVEDFERLSPIVKRLTQLMLGRTDMLLVSSREAVSAFEGYVGESVQWLPCEARASVVQHQNHQSLDRCETESQECTTPTLSVDALEKGLDAAYQCVIFRNGSPRVRAWRFFFGRLAEMSGRELGHRLGHVMKKNVIPFCLERKQLSPGSPGVPYPQLTFRGLLAPAFVATYPMLYANVAAEREQLAAVEEAVRIRNGQRVLFTNWVQLDTPIAYACDPETRTKWPMVAFHQVLARGPMVDIKPVWELGKLTELARLSWISLALDEPEYRSYVVEEARRFLAENPVGRGPQWVSALEVSIRIVSLLWILTSLGAETNPHSSGVQELIAHVAEHLAFLYRERSVFLDRNNHLLGEAVGLLIGGLALPDLPQADTYQAEGLRILECELPRQLDGCGYDREGSTDYHRQVVEWLVQATLVLRRLLPSKRDRVEPYLAAALTSSSALADRYGNLPVYGDTDNARIFSLAPIPGTSAEPFQLYYKALFGGKDEEKRGPEDALLALVLRAVTADDDVAASRMDRIALRLASAPKASAAQFVSRDEGIAPGGIHRLSDLPDKKDGIDLYFKVGEMGLPPHGGHAHADLLSLQLFQGGRCRLGDPGTHRYGGTYSYRPRLRRSCHHATLSLPFDQADSLDLFKWATRPLAYPSHHVAAEGVDVVTAGHDGYVRCRSGAVHRREVVRIEGGTVLVIDRLGGTGTTRITFPYPLPEAVVRLERTPLGSEGCEVVYEDGGRLAIFSPHADLEAVHRSGFPDAVHSNYYSHIVPVYRFELTGHVKLPFATVTLLHFSPPSQPRPVVMNVKWSPLIIEVMFAPLWDDERVVRQILYRQGSIGDARYIEVTEYGQTRLVQTLGDAS